MGGMGKNLKILDEDQFPVRIPTKNRSAIKPHPYSHNDSPITITNSGNTPTHYQ
jgi:hypothetical protein